jgi:hypothetical protein
MTMRHKVAAVLLSIGLFAAASQGAGTPGGWTVTPAPLGDEELVNPGRGLFQWNGQAELPIPCPDRYARYNWSVVEKSKGTYDFSILEAQAAAAKLAGGTFGFGIRCVVSGVAMACPAYVKDEVAGWTSVKKTSWVPDWNSEAFLTRVEALTAALGAKFNRDPRIGYIEIRTYGNWGEWHLSDFEDPPAPMQPITQQSIRRIIDAWARAFPDTQLIMMSDSEGGLEYAMSLTHLRHPVGWRRDSWGNKQFYTLNRHRAAWELAKDRWKTAPVTVESYGGAGHDTAKALAQTSEYHVSAIGNGNLARKWDQIPPIEQQMLIECAKTSGYRYALQQLDLTTTGALVFSASWLNSGVAPIYTDWNVRYLLRRQKSGHIAWNGTSKLRLRELLPTLDRTTKKQNPIEVIDRFPRPADLTAGTYSVEVVVTDRTGYFTEPLRLAIQGRRPDGAYALGNIELK